MQWIKRNLFFVIGGVIALALIGLAGYYAYDSTGENAKTDEDINQQNQEIKRLYDLVPFPAQTNIDALKAEQTRTEAFVTDSKAYFAPFEKYPKTSQRDFVELLGTSIFDLQRRATNSGILIPPAYGFGFANQLHIVKFSEASIDPWLSQLAEIKAVCNILFQSKIIELYGVRRVAVTDDDRSQQGGSGNDYLASSVIVTNQTAVFTPYEVSFRGFSSELANVLTGFLQASNSFLVKSVNIEPAPFTPPVAPAPTPAAPTPVYQPQPRAYNPAPGGGTAEAYMAERYGAASPITRPTFTRPQPVQTPTAAARPAASVTVLSEKPLRITLLIEAVRLKGQ